MRVRTPVLPVELGRLVFNRTPRSTHQYQICSSFRPNRQSRYYSVKPQKAVPDFAFAFDIDGVLLRSSSPIPGASRALSHLQQNGIPFILLTNGGGKHESARVAELSKKLSVPIDMSMIVQSHTPFASLVDPSKHHPEGLKDKCVLVLGGDAGKCRDVAHAYGFRNVLIPGDILAAHPTIWPFSSVFNDYYKSFAVPPANQALIHPSSPERGAKIDAIFVFNDPRDWALDIQIVLDILLSESGILGTYSSKNGDRTLPNNGFQQDGQPRLYFSNPDLLWAASYHLPRLGQGGFREALEGVWAAVTGGPPAGVQLHKEVIGKPFRATYEFAETHLMAHRNELFGRDQAQFTATATNPLHRVYMVGDNPESDIRGANTFDSPRGVEWISLLVRTGVHQDRPGHAPTWAPREIVDDAYAAVRWALIDSNWPSGLPKDKTSLP